MCFYIKEITPLCWTLSSVFPRSFHPVSYSFPLRDTGRIKDEDLRGAGEGQQGLLRSVPFPGPAESSCGTSLSPASPTAGSSHRPRVPRGGARIQSTPGWSCIDLLHCFISCSQHRRWAPVDPLLMLAEEMHKLVECILKILQKSRPCPCISFSLNGPTALEVKISQMRISLAL